MFLRRAYLRKALLCLTVVVGCFGSLDIQPLSASTPSQWPASPGLNPEIEAWPNAIRFYGEDRHQTNLAVALALRGAGNFPFGDPDPTSAGAVSYTHLTLPTIYSV